MALKCNKERIIDTKQFTAPDYKGDESEWVRYAFRKEDPIPIPAGVTVTDSAYTKILEDGKTQTIFYGTSRFYKIEDDWYELEYDTVTKEEWDDNDT